MMELKRENFVLTTDKTRLQVAKIHHFLSKEAYWSQDISLEVVKKSIEGSICLGIFDESISDKPQIGFARIITDKATFAWLCDVYIEEAYRGRGLSKWLIESLLTLPDLKGLRRICLATKDAHSLYERYGFEVTQTPQNWLEIKNNNIYQKSQ